MKIMMTFFIFLSTSIGLASEITLDMLVGTFKISSKNAITEIAQGIIVEYDVTLLENKNLYMIEKVIQRIEGQQDKLLSRYKCEGSAQMSSVESSVIISSVDCDEGPKFAQKIYLDRASNVDLSTMEFTAPVFSTLYKQEVNMFFKKIQ